MRGADATRNTSQAVPPAHSYASVDDLRHAIADGAPGGRADRVKRRLPDQT
jgi:hypothetical protein